MKYTSTLLLSTIILIGIPGCSSEHSDSAEIQTTTEKETVFQPQIDALKKAKQVEGIMQQHDQDTRQAIEQESSGNR
jgi:hypothetical protein